MLYHWRRYWSAPSLSVRGESEREPALVLLEPAWGVVQRGGGNRISWREGTRCTISLVLLAMR